MHAGAQEQQGLLEDSLKTKISTKYLETVSNKAEGLEKKINAKSAKTLRQFQQQELRMHRKLSKLDSLKAKQIFGDAQQQYASLENKLKDAKLNRYIPSLDSIGTSLKFLEQNPQFLSSAKDAGQKLKYAIDQVNGLKTELQKAEDIKTFIRQRKDYLRSQLKDLGFAKELKKLSKQSYYAAAQLNEYRELLKDHKKAERKTLELLTKTKLFKDFFRKNSMLASLFRLPGDDPSSFGGASLAGLQTRSQVTALIQSQISSGGPNAQQQLQQNIQQAQSELNRLKDKMNQAGGGSSDEELPDFKINNQRKKNFWKKWELGVNTQSNKPNSFFPVTTDISMMAGFRPHDNYVVGIGIGGLIGWGKDIRHIDISSQGMSIKSFAEIKIRGSFHFATEYEMVYRNEIRNIEQLKDRSVWQYSGLAGLSKVVSLKTKFFKKTKLQLMWDFLSYRQVPRTQAILFRVSYNIK